MADITEKSRVPLKWLAILIVPLIGGVVFIFNMTRSVEQKVDQSVESTSKKMDDKLTQANRDMMSKLSEVGSKLSDLTATTTKLNEVLVGHAKRIEKLEDSRDVLIRLDERTRRLEDLLKDLKDKR